ncbi:MAG: hypothetical protein ACOYNC_10120 [Bacteroidales bacterium]
MPEKKLTQPRRTVFFLLIGIILIVNVILLIVRYQNDTSMFNTPLKEGTSINGKYLDSDKEILFILIKPKCPTCLQYQDSINSLYQKYINHLQFVGLCRVKFWDTAYLTKYHFPMIKADLNTGKMLHLAVTPQIVMVKNKTVTFSQEFRTNFDNEYQRLKKYLENKYPR